MLDCWGSRGGSVCKVDAPVVERHTRQLLANMFTSGGVTWKSYPTPERDEESKPSKCEHSPIHVDGVEAGD